MYNNIKKIREKRGLTIEQLSQKMQISAQQIYYLESGRRRLSDIWLKKISENLECYPSELLDDSWQRKDIVENIDEDILSLVIELVIDSSKQLKKELSPEQMAKVINLIYVEYKDSVDRLSEDLVMGLIRGYLLKS